MRRIRISRELTGRHSNSWLRVKTFSEKLDAYFIDVRCPECEVDNYLASGLAELFNPNHNQIVVYLEGYYWCDSKVREFIDKYFNTFDFSNSVIVIEETCMMNAMHSL